MNKQAKYTETNRAAKRFDSANVGIGKILSLLSRGSDVKADKAAHKKIMHKLYPYIGTVKAETVAAQHETKGDDHE